MKTKLLENTSTVEAEAYQSDCEHIKQELLRAASQRCLGTKFWQEVRYLS